MSRQKTGSAAHGFSAEDVARIDSWIIEIAAKHLGGVVREEAHGEWRVGDDRRLVVHQNGCWHDFLADKTSHGTLSLLAHLLRDDVEAALRTARAWLAQHNGDGQLGGDSGGDENQVGEDAEAIATDDAWRKAHVQTLWQCAEVIDGTPAEPYEALAVTPSRRARRREAAATHEACQIGRARAG
jgi:hypothetical protein